MYKIIKNWLWAFLLIVTLITSNGLLRYLKTEVQNHERIEFKQEWHFNEIRYTKFDVTGTIVERFWAKNLLRHDAVYTFSVPRFEIKDQQNNLWIITAESGDKNEQDIHFRQKVKIYPKYHWSGFSGYLAGEKLHYQIKPQRYVLSPFILHFQDQEKQVWQITAQQADSNNLADFMLNQQVTIECPKKALQINTDQLQLNLLKKFAFTKLPLYIQEQETQINSVGGKFWLTNGVLELLSKIKIQYDFKQ